MHFPACVALHHYICNDITSIDPYFTVVENPGEREMRITVKDGQELTRYEACEVMGDGRGVRAGITYRLDDGRMIYVPEGGPSSAE